MPDAPLLQVKALLQSIQDKKEEQRRLQKLWEDGQTEIQVVAAYSAVRTWQQPGLLHICMRAQRWCHVILKQPCALQCCFACNGILTHTSCLSVCPSNAQRLVKLILNHAGGPSLEREAAAPGGLL